LCMMVSAYASFPLQAPSINPCRYPEPFNTSDAASCDSLAMLFHPNRRLKFHKHRQLFIRTHNVTLPVAMRVSIPSILFKQFLQVLV
jgi:hypothetical protein